jgi:invasion protein IalB
MSLIFGLLVVPTAALAQTEGSVLPEGVTSVQEVYQDWRVSCVKVEGATQCAMSQEQVQENGQRVLAIELTSAAEAGLTGTLVLPFGLALSSGVVFQIDDGALDPSLPFSTCVPAGCIVEVAFDPVRVEGFSNGEMLTLNVVTADNRQPAALNVSLKGFRPALDRMLALSQ